MAGEKENNLHLRKDCCIGCRCDGDFCVYREELDDDVGNEFVKDDGLMYTKGCKYFEWD